MAEEATRGQPLALRAGVALLAVIPLGLCLGVPFPAGGANPGSAAGRGAWATLLWAVWGPVPGLRGLLPWPWRGMAFSFAVATLLGAFLLLAAFLMAGLRWLVPAQGRSEPAPPGPAPDPLPATGMTAVSSPTSATGPERDERHRPPQPGRQHPGPAPGRRPHRAVRRGRIRPGRRAAGAHQGPPRGRRLAGGLRPARGRGCWPWWTASRRTRTASWRAPSPPTSTWSTWPKSITACASCAGGRWTGETPRGASRSCKRCSAPPGPASRRRRCRPSSPAAPWSRSSPPTPPRPAGAPCSTTCAG